MVQEVQEEPHQVGNQEVVQQEVKVLPWEQTQGCMAELRDEPMS